MFRSFNIILAAGLLFAASSVRADLSYQQKLDALNQATTVQFSSILPFVKKVEGVNQLYRVVFETGGSSTAYFKKDGVIQNVYIHEAIGTDPQSIAARSLLRQNTILFDYSGSDSDTVLKEMGTFPGELTDIQALEQKIAQKVPGVLLDRTLSLSEKVTNTNRSYLENLRQLDAVLSNYRYSSRLADFGKLWVQDSASLDSTTTIQTYNYTDYAEARSTSKKGVMIRFGREGFYQEKSRVSQDLIQQLFEIILVNQFDQVDYSLLNNDQVVSLIADFTHFLTADRIAKLKARGVHRFYFTERWEKETDLLVGGRLTLGVTQADMERIYAVLFGS